MALKSNIKQRHKYYNNQVMNRKIKGNVQVQISLQLHIKPSSKCNYCLCCFFLLLFNVLFCYRIIQIWILFHFIRFMNYDFAFLFQMLVKFVHHSIKFFYSQHKSMRKKYIKLLMFQADNIGLTIKIRSFLSKYYVL